MKTTVTFKSITIIVIMILAATLCFAATHHPKESNDLKKFMEKHVGYPEFAKENSLSGFVVISFEVTKEGRIDLKAINASTPDFKDYVENKLKNLTIDNPQKYQGKTNYYRFDFHIIPDK